MLGSHLLGSLGLERVLFGVGVGDLLVLIHFLPAVLVVAHWLMLVDRATILIVLL